MTDTLNSQILGYAGGDAAIEVRAYYSEAEFEGGRPMVSPATFLLNVGPELHSGRLPAVSCLMVTDGRVEQAKLAVACYRDQTWPKRELVIIDRSSNSTLATWVKSLHDPSIRIFSQRRDVESLGAARNRAAAIARGHFLCQWDDGDLQHPLRIEMAMAAMAVSHAPAAMLFRQMTWDAGRNRVAIGARRPHENTLIAARRAMPTYPSLDEHHEAPAVEALLARHRAVLIDAPELSVDVAHGQGSWPNGGTANGWQKATERFEGDAARRVLAALRRAYPAMDTYPVERQAA
jgi:hypothetical protein